MGADEKILQYMTAQNRPYSATDVLNNLHKEIGKTQVPSLTLTAGIIILFGHFMCFPSFLTRFSYPTWHQHPSFVTGGEKPGSSGGTG